MATVINPCEISLSLLLLLFSLDFFTIFQPISALKIELIHRFSPDSPLNPGNLTDHEIKIKLAQLSQARALSLPPSPTQARPIVMGEEHTYYVQVEIGSPSMATFLALDTGSNLVWTQCSGCDPCMAHPGPLFDPSASISLNRVQCFRDICTYYDYPCIDKACSYAYYYNKNNQTWSTQGQLFTEVFSFNSIDGGFALIDDVIFGCGSAQTGFRLGNNVSGILGMGPRPGSLVSQLNVSGNATRFSYCLPKIAPGMKTFLHIGSDATITNQKTTPMITSQGEELRNYTVNLVGITIADQRVDFAPGSLGSGCMVDTGMYQTVIPRSGYVSLELTMRSYFHRFPEVGEPVDRSDIGYHLCFNAPRGFAHVPDMMYHFDGADLHVPVENVMDVYPGSGSDHDLLCWNVNPSDLRLTYLGTAHQVNYRFLYDLANRQISFAPETCGGN